MQPSEGGDIPGVARGFAYSIYLMLALVFGLIGTIVFFIVRTIRREAREEER